MYTLCFHLGIKTKRQSVLPASFAVCFCLPVVCACVPYTAKCKQLQWVYSKFYDKYILVGDFNAEESEPCLSQFLFELSTRNIVKEPTCFKSLSNPSCIDLVIINSFSNFQNTKAVSAGLSGFNKMVVSVLKHTFHRSAAKELVYRNYKNFDRVIFKRELEDKLNQQINE